MVHLSIRGFKDAKHLFHHSFTCPKKIPSGYPFAFVALGLEERKNLQKTKRRA
jgi:hypothetical protein